MSGAHLLNIEPSSGKNFEFVPARVQSPLLSDSSLCDGRCEKSYSNINPVPSLLSGSSRESCMETGATVGDDTGFHKLISSISNLSNVLLDLKSATDAPVSARTHIEALQSSILKLSECLVIEQSIVLKQAPVSFVQNVAASDVPERLDGTFGRQFCLDQLPKIGIDPEGILSHRKVFEGSHQDSKRETSPPCTVLSQKCPLKLQGLKVFARNNNDFSANSENGAVCSKSSCGSCEVSNYAEASAMKFQAKDIEVEVIAQKLQEESAMESRDLQEELAMESRGAALLEEMIKFASPAASDRPRRYDLRCRGNTNIPVEMMHQSFRGENLCHSEGSHLQQSKDPSREGSTKDVLKRAHDAPALRQVDNRNSVYWEQLPRHAPAFRQVENRNILHAEHRNSGYWELQSRLALLRTRPGWEDDYCEAAETPRDFIVPSAESSIHDGSHCQSKLAKDMPVTLMTKPSQSKADPLVAVFSCPAKLTDEGDDSVDVGSSIDSLDYWASFGVNSDDTTHSAGFHGQPSMPNMQIFDLLMAQRFMNPGPREAVSNCGERLVYPASSLAISATASRVEETGFMPHNSEHSSWVLLPD